MEAVDAGVDDGDVDSGARVRPLEPCAGPHLVGADQGNALVEDRLVPLVVPEAASLGPGGHRPTCAAVSVAKAIGSTWSFVAPTPSESMRARPARSSNVTIVLKLAAAGAAASHCVSG